MVRTDAGHLCFKFSPIEPEHSSRFNPLAEIRLFTDRDISDAQNIANMIIRTGEDSPQERYWQDATVSITTGMILHVGYARAEHGYAASLTELSGVLTRPGITFRETLEELLNYPHDRNGQRNWRLPTGEPTRTHPVVKEKVQEMLDKEDKDFSGVLSTAKTALTLYSDPLVSRCTSSSDFTIQDLVNHERPISLYLVVPISTACYSSSTNFHHSSVWKSLPTHSRIWQVSDSRLTSSPRTFGKSSTSTVRMRASSAIAKSAWRLPLTSTRLPNY
jgi:type IV secretion system protein VirD4